MLDKLLESGVPSSSEAKDKQSCLTLALGKSDVAICQCLMAAGAKVNMTTSHGPSDLRLAIQSDCPELVRALLQHLQYAHRQSSTFETDLRFAIRRYAESTCRFGALAHLLDKALEKPSGQNPGFSVSKADMLRIHTAALQAACQRADSVAIQHMIDQGAVVDADCLGTSLAAGNLGVIGLLLNVRVDIKPSTAEVSTELGYEDCKLIQLLIDQSGNALDDILEAPYPHFGKLFASREYLPLPSPTIYAGPTSPHATALDVRFARVLPLVAYHGDPWGFVLKRLLDKSLHVSNREHHMDAALHCACCLFHDKTQQTLLDWCQDSPLKSKLLPGLGKGLLRMMRVGKYDSELHSDVQRIRNSKLNVPADKFCGIYDETCAGHDFWALEIRQVLLVWGVEIARRDVDFASALGFVPTNNTEDQQRLREHLRSRRSFESHAVNANAMIRPEMM